MIMLAELSQLAGGHNHLEVCVRSLETPTTVSESERIACCRGSRLLLGFARMYSYFGGLKFSVCLLTGSFLAMLSRLCDRALALLGAPAWVDRRLVDGLGESTLLLLVLVSCSRLLLFSGSGLPLLVLSAPAMLS